MKIVTGTQMQTLDRRTITEARVPSLVLMERAGAGAANFIQHRYGPLRGKTVTILCGKGNNGGDGLVVASCASFKPGLRCFSSYPPPI